MIWLFFVVTKNVILWRLYWVYFQLRMAYKHGALAPWRTWNERGPLACMMHPRHHLPHPSEPHRASSSKACRYTCHWTWRRYTAVTKEPWSIAEELLPRSLSRREVAAISIVKASFHPCSPPCLEDLTSWSAAISHCWSLAWTWSGEPQLHATGSPPILWWSLPRLIASLVDSRQPDPCPPFSTMRPAHGIK